MTEQFDWNKALEGDNSQPKKHNRLWESDDELKTDQEAINRRLATLNRRYEQAVLEEESKVKPFTWADYLKDAKSLNEKVSLITKHLSFGDPHSYETKYYGIFYDIVKDPNFKSEWRNLKASNGDHLVFWIVERHAISAKNLKQLHRIGRAMDNLFKNIVSQVGINEILSVQKEGLSVIDYVKAKKLEGLTYDFLSNELATRSQQISSVKSEKSESLHSRLRHHRRKYASEKISSEVLGEANVPSVSKNVSQEGVKITTQTPRASSHMHRRKRYRGM